MFGLLNKTVAITLPFVPKPIVGFFSKKYIAGDSIDDAIAVVKDLNSKNIMATVDVLGEDIKDISEAYESRDEYYEVLGRLNTEKLNANISIKLSQMGLKLNREKCLEIMTDIVKKARSLDNFVRIDMEDVTLTDDTLYIYTKLKEKFDNVGVVLQAYLRRTIDDINGLYSKDLNFRLCKGIYIEKRDFAYKDMRIINESFIYNLKKMFNANAYVGIATHDEYIVFRALALIDEMKIPRTRYEFQMLLGVDEKLRDIIVSQGHRLRVYVPFGKHWHAYSVRRLKENPSIAGHIMKDIIRL